MNTEQLNTLYDEIVAADPVDKMWGAETWYQMHEAQLVRYFKHRYTGQGGVAFASFCFTSYQRYVELSTGLS